MKIRVKPNKAVMFGHKEGLGIEGGGGAASQNMTYFLKGGNVTQGRLVGFDQED